MNDNNVYRVEYKTVASNGSSDVINVGGFECDRSRYLFEIEKAAKNCLSFNATDTFYASQDGSSAKIYLLSIYFW